MTKLRIMFACMTLTMSLMSMQWAVAGHGNGDEAFTAWAFVFNNPENCDGVCDEFNDVLLADGAVLYLTGQRVQRNGRAIFAGTINANVNNERIFGRLTNAGGAEIHVGLQSHGPVAATSEDRDAQTTLDGGACNPECEIKQFAIFPPGAGLGTSQDGTVTWASDGTEVRRSAATIRRVDVGDGDEVVVISIDTRL